MNTKTERAAEQVRIIVLTEAGKKLSEQLAAAIPGAEICYRPKPFADTVQRFFQNGGRLIFICATGIIIRTLAPVLKDKYSDPAVLAMDEEGKFVIPLLSGHEGGANEWARQVADILSAQVVSTTAENYQKPLYTVGLGCERNCPPSFMEELLKDCLSKAGITAQQVHSFSSIDIKSDEQGMIQLAQTYQRPFITWNADELRLAESHLQNPSQYVYDTVGVYGVAESAALYSALQHEPSGDISKTELVVPKHKNAKATCAIARVYLK